MAILTNYYEFSSITQTGGQQILPANPARTSITLTPNNTVAFGNSVADIAGGAGGFVLVSGDRFTLKTTDPIFALAFGSLDLRVIEEYSG